jgi:hypothetical protein
MQLLDPSLVELADGTRSIPLVLDQALRNISLEKVFVVRLSEDVERSAAELEQVLSADLENQDRRRLRYYAAGEYLNVSTHLLVAVWNGRRESSFSGTSAVVEARLAGPRAGLLPTASALPVHHGGPVWHLLAQRPAQPEKTERAPCNEAHHPLPPLRFLYPAVTSVSNIKPGDVLAGGQSKQLFAQSEWFNLFARIGENIQVFNTERVDSPRNRTHELKKMLRDPEGDRVHDRLQAEHPNAFQKLAQLSAVRTRGSDLSQWFQTKAKRTLAAMFWLALVAASLLHLHAHWHPAPAHESVASHELGADHGQSTVKKGLSGIQLVFGWAALVLALAGLGYFAWRRALKLDARGHDARAIAEGLRVQFYWNLAGLGRSVPANYMSRHRSELDWIRGVIRAATSPYLYWKDWFQVLPAELQLKLWNVVREAWVRHQRTYFRGASHRERHILHLWHELGGVTALGGVIVFLLLVVSGGVPWSPRGFLRGLMAAIFAVSVTGTYTWLAAWRSSRQTQNESGASNSVLWSGLEKAIGGVREQTAAAWSQSAADTVPRSLWRALITAGAAIASSGPVVLELVNILVPAFADSSLKQTSYLGRLLRGLISFLAYVPLAMLLAFVAVSCCRLVHTWLPHAPEYAALSQIAGGFLLLAGALSVAWAEKNLRSEFAYQYDTMAAVFETAYDRLGTYMSEFKQALEDADERAKSEIQERIQSLIFELGQEALDENAEWLILHRARPLEPVMAG